MKPSPSRNSCQLVAYLVSTLSSLCPHLDEFKANPRHHPQISQYIYLSKTLETKKKQKKSQNHNTIISPKNYL